jgi:glycosyltransferase involved in cell wall biosynthesis
MVHPWKGCVLQSTAGSNPVLSAIFIMKNTPHISVFIICLNEEKKIEACLRQAKKIADEIILVDSGSTDGTLNIAKQYTDKIYHQDWLGYGAQKNHALSLCNNEWVLSLDADEVLTDELIEEIKSLNFKADGYQIARKLFIGERFIRYGGYFPDYQLRLFKKSKGGFSNKPVHESVELSGTLQYLKSPLNHFAYKDTSELERAFNNYAKLSTHTKNILQAYSNLIFSFINKYFIRLGFLEGSLGLALAIIHAKYSRDKYLL